MILELFTCMNLRWDVQICEIQIFCRLADLDKSVDFHHYVVSALLTFLESSLVKQTWRKEPVVKNGIPCSIAVYSMFQ